MRNQQVSGDLKGNSLIVVGLELRDANNNILQWGDQKVTIVDNHLDKRSRFSEQAKGNYDVLGKFWADNRGFGGSHYLSARKFVGNLQYKSPNAHEKLIVKVYGGVTSNISIEVWDN